MKFVFCVLLFSASTLFAQKAPFASQSDLVADLSDTVLNGIYHHRLGFERCDYERSVWVEGFGDYRRRNSSSDRSRYDNWSGGALGGFNYALSCDAYLNFFFGGSWGEIDIRDESNFDTYSLLFGMTYERFCECSSFAFALAGGYLAEERHYNGVHEEPRGLFLTPELTYAYQFNNTRLCPILTSTLRYAGYFPRDYQHRETLGTLYVQDRSIQFITLRGEISAPLNLACTAFAPYLGIVGRFQFDGNHVEGWLIQTNERFSDGIDSTIGYGLLGLRFSKNRGCLDCQANFEAGYDTDESWRILGEINLNYAF